MLPLLLSVLLAVVLRVFVLQSFWIPSASMEPTLHGCPDCRDDHVLVFRLSYRLHAIHRDDVVVFHRPPGLSEPDKFVIKRVIGLPGETVRAQNGVVYVGDRSLSEDFVNPACRGTADFAAVRIPMGDVFVMGDNRCDSSDSRVFGPIPTSSIVGHAVLRVWPVWPVWRLGWL